MNRRSTRTALAAMAEPSVTRHLLACLRQGERGSGWSVTCQSAWLVVLLLLCGCQSAPTGMNQGEAALARLLAPSADGSQTQEDLLALTRAQKPALMRYWRRCPTQADRLKAIWPLAYIGGDDVRVLFFDCFRQDWNRTNWARDEISLSETLAALGFLAQRDDAAFRFLTNAMVPEAWGHLRIQGGAGGEELTVRQSMSMISIRASARSGRAEIGRLLESWRQRLPDWIQGDASFALRPLIYLAMVDYQVVRKMGVETYRSRMRTRERGEVAVAWRLSPEGMEWYNWMLAGAPGKVSKTQEELEASFRWQEGLDESHP